MEKDRDQLTPDDPDDLAKLQGSRGQGTGGTGSDLLPGEEPPAEFGDGPPTASSAGERSDEETQ